MSFQYTSSSSCVTVAVVALVPEVAEPAMDGTVPWELAAASTFLKGSAGGTTVASSARRMADCSADAKSRAVANRCSRSLASERATTASIAVGSFELKELGGGGVWPMIW